MQQVSTTEQSSQDSVVARVPQERYAYFRRCQVFRKGGEQCKAPAEKDSHICYAHAGQQALTLRRKLQLMVVLAEVARRMRARGKPEFEVADIFMDFNAIQVTLPVMAEALIDGRIDCKTAGRLALGLQTAAKLLRMMQSKGTSTIAARRHGEEPGLPQIFAVEHTEKASTSKGPKEREVVPDVKAGKKWAANQHENTRTNLRAEVLAFADIHGWAHGPPGWPRAA
jgi:hypothetical protein